MGADPDGGAPPYRLAADRRLRAPHRPPGRVVVGEREGVGRVVGVVVAEGAYAGGVPTGAGGGNVAVAGLTGAVDASAEEAAVRGS